MCGIEMAKFADILMLSGLLLGVVSGTLLCFTVGKSQQILITPCLIARSPAIGAPLGAALFALSWRWPWYFIAVLGGILWISALFLMPTIPRAKSEKPDLDLVGLILVSGESACLKPSPACQTTDSADHTNLSRSGLSCFWHSSSSQRKQVQKSISPRPTLHLCHAVSSVHSRRKKTW